LRGEPAKYPALFSKFHQPLNIFFMANTIAAKASTIGTTGASGANGYITGLAVHDAAVTVGIQNLVNPGPVVTLSPTAVLSDGVFFYFTTTILYSTALA